MGTNANTAAIKRPTPVEDRPHRGPSLHPLRECHFMIASEHRILIETPRQRPERVPLPGRVQRN